MVWNLRPNRTQNFKCVFHVTKTRVPCRTDYFVTADSSSHNGMNFFLPYKSTALRPATTEFVIRINGMCKNFFDEIFLSIKMTCREHILQIQNNFFIIKNEFLWIKIAFFELNDFKYNLFLINSIKTNKTFVSYF